MINHARTLMINAQLPNNSMYGSEYIDPTFRPLQLSTRGRLIRETLFGSDIIEPKPEPTFIVGSLTK